MPGAACQRTSNGRRRPGRRRVAYTLTANLFTAAPSLTGHLSAPPATKLLAADGGALGVRFTVYALIQVIATACTMGMSREVRLGGMLRPDAPERARHPDLVPYLATMLVFLVSIPVSYFSAWAFAIWALSPLFGRWLSLFAARRGIVTRYS